MLHEKDLGKTLGVVLYYSSSVNVLSMLSLAIAGACAGLPIVGANNRVTLCHGAVLYLRVYCSTLDLYLVEVKNTPDVSRCSPGKGG